MLAAPTWSILFIYFTSNLKAISFFLWQLKKIHCQKWTHYSPRSSSFEGILARAVQQIEEKKRDQLPLSHHIGKIIKICPVLVSECWAVGWSKRYGLTDRHRTDGQTFFKVHTPTSKNLKKKKFNFETVFFLQKKGQQLPNFIHFSNSVTTIISLFIEIQNFEVGSYE